MSAAAGANKAHRLLHIAGVCFISALVASCGEAPHQPAPDSAVAPATFQQSTEQQPTSKLHQPSSPMPESFYQASTAELKRNFQNPPDAVKPWVYWYWVNDHISKSGIENDLAAMQKAGISTALIGIIHLKPSIGGYGSVAALSDEWWDHLRFAIEKAADCDIDIGLFNSPGWSQSGGPWVNLDQSMRYLDSTEYQVSGPSHQPITLSEPDGFTQSVKVIAFKTPAGEAERLNQQQTTMSIESHGLSNPIDVSDSKALIDGDPQSVYLFPSELVNQKSEANSAAELQIDFNHQQPLRAQTLAIYPHQPFSAQATLSAKTASGEFQVIREFSLQRPRDKAAIGPDHDAPIVINFAPVESQQFRLSLTAIKQTKVNSEQVPGLKEVVLSAGYKLERYVEKKLAKVHPTPQPKHDSYIWPAPLTASEPAMAIDASQVLDVTEFVSNGQLNWHPPEGQWTVVHYFMRPTGTTNGPSSANARGPEIDKLSKSIAQFHFDAYIGQILTTMKPEQRRALKYAVVDSYEQGAQNWTDGFADKFQQQFGYDPIPFLPVYTGRIVNSAQQSERFLWDMRRLVADKVSYQYTAGLRERAHQHGLKLWLENYGHWGFPGEFLQYGGQADIVSGEFWASGNLGAIELKAASSAAHIYGHKTVMSESFTAGRSDSFKNHPWHFKKRGDWSFVEGINHTLLHVYIQQAYDDRFPGVNAWFGSEFNRHNPWFDFMGSWLDYIKRANYMMQQGNYVADIMYFIGEDVPKMTGELKPAVPAGYSYDFINAEVILNRLTVQDGEFVLPNGMRFKLLVLPNLATMRPQVLTKLSQLVADGGAIYGPKPSHSPSLQNYPAADKKVTQLANALWQQIDGYQIKQAQFGNGQVFYSTEAKVDLATIMAQLKRPEDLSGLPESVIWSHRQSDSHDIYFIANQSESDISIAPSFRSQADLRPPQRWDAVTGQIQQVGQFLQQQGRVTVPMTLKGLESTFVVFARTADTPAINSANSMQQPVIKAISKLDESLAIPTWLSSALDSSGNVILDVAANGNYQIEFTSNQKQQISVNDLPSPKVLEQPWQLTLQQNRDVATELELAQLVSLTELQPLALQHYSGVVSYRNEFQLDAQLLRSDQRWLLDLGEVGVIARVQVNGKDFGELWSRPLQVDITNALKAGHNQLHIEVATTWLNRLVGDQKYPEQWPDSAQPKQFQSQITFATKINKQTPLQPSGLIGPVQLKPIRTITLSH
ncbi:glycoside hydrolase [Neiella sp. HB171785]|uniref:Glycoside hydrolase n=2 Tax=Neiella litorisoli TaxID=2771431 RepID=A0A8J6QQF1_9GAMM|nr:glycoside hydrolase [Neiella litorisoli]